MNLRFHHVAAGSVLAIAAAAPALAQDLSGATAYGYASGTFAIGCTTCGHWDITLDADPNPILGGAGFTSAAFDYFGQPVTSAVPNPGEYTLEGDVSMAAWATFEGALATPSLHARAGAHNKPVYLTADVDRTVNVGVDYYTASATAETVQRYTYIGTGSATYTFTFSVDGKVTDMRTGVFGAAGFYDDFLETNYAFGSVYVEGQGLAPYTPPVDFAQTFELTMTFNEGESFYMKSWLTAGVTGMYASGSPFADAYDTLHVTGVTGGDARLLLPSLVGPVPEPGTVALWLAGVAAFGFMRARQRR
jgi:hypothetical protein